MQFRHVPPHDNMKIALKDIYLKDVYSWDFPCC